MSFLINGSTPATLGLSVAARELVNQGIDRVVLEIVNTTLAEEHLFEYRDDITITYNGDRWFQGKVARLPRWGASAAIGSTYEIWGPWWDLSLLTYEQSWNGSLTSRVLIGADVVIGGTGVPVGASSISYGADEEDAVPVDTNDELGFLIGFAIERGVDIALGDLPAGITIPPEEFSDRKVSELLMAIMRWHPYTVTYFDYTPSTPVLHIKARADMSAASIDSTNATVTDLSVQSRDELRPPAIVLRYECKSNGAPILQYTDIFPALASGEEIGAFIATISLDEGEAWNIDTPPVGSFLIDIPYGLAEYFYDAYLAVMYDGTLTMVEEDLPATEYMGKKLNLTGGLSAWESMNAPVQSVVQDPRQGSTVLNFGSGENIGLDDLLRLAELFRKRKPKAQQSRDRAPAAPTGQAPFEIYAAKVGADWKVFVYTGIISTGEIEGETFVSDTTGAIIGYGGALDRWLYVEFEPETALVTLYDVDLVEFYEYRMLGTVTILDAEIATSDTEFGSARAPTFDAEDGTITESGKFYFYLGNCVFNTGDAAPTPNNNRTGNFTLLFIPPNRCFLMPESGA